MQESTDVHDANAMLKIKGLQVNYGGIQAVKGIDLEVAQGELVTLIGANGAGKTTTMKAITGLQAVCRGRHRVHGPVDQGRAAARAAEARPRDGAGRPRHFRAHVDCREHADGRLSAHTTTTASRPTSIACSASSRA